MPKPDPINMQSRKQRLRPAVCDSLPPEGPWYEQLRIVGGYELFDDVDFCDDTFDEPGEVPINGGHCNVSGTGPNGSSYHIYLNYAFGVDWRKIDVEIGVRNWSCVDIDGKWLWENWAGGDRFFFGPIILMLPGGFSLNIEVTVPAA